MMSRVGQNRDTSGRETGRATVVSEWTNARRGKTVTYPEEAFEVDAPGVQGPVQMVHRIFDGVVLCHEIDQPAIARARKQTHGSTAPVEAGRDR